MDLKETDILGERIGEQEHCRSKRAATQRLPEDINGAPNADGSAGAKP
ncbi:hypothetical protein ACNFH5_02650 [Pseudomonas sp. NY15435]